MKKTKTHKSNKELIPDGPKILLFDIETSPITTYAWSLWQKFTPLSMLKEDTYMLTWAAKWLGKKEVYGVKLPDFKSHYKKNRECDLKLVEALWTLLDEADVVVAHNAAGFDVPKVNARFLFHEMSPPSPYKVIDTLAIARREFRLTSNKLDHLGEYLNLGKKNETTFDLWLGCMSNKKESWDEMMAYNIQDVHLLEKVYLKLRAWDRRAPNLSLYIDTNNPACTVCGSTHLNKKGIAYTGVGMYQRYRCMDCGHPLRGRHTIVPKDRRKSILTNEF